MKTFEKQLKTNVMNLKKLKNRLKEFGHFTDVMIDIETLDTKPKSVILSIAAIAFNIDSGEISENKLDLSINYENQIDEGRTTSIETTLWWGRQSDKARNSAFGQEHELRDALDLLIIYIGNSCIPGVRVWAKSPSFDLVILKDAYGEYAVLPWEYYNERDVRTLLSICQSLKSEKGIISHIAIDDCEKQIDNVCAAYRLIKNGLST